MVSDNETRPAGPDQAVGSSYKIGVRTTADGLTVIRAYACGPNGGLVRMVADFYLESAAECGGWDQVVERGLATARLYVEALILGNSGLGPDDVIQMAEQLGRKLDTDQAVALLDFMDNDIERGVSVANDAIFDSLGWFFEADPNGEEFKKIEGFDGDESE